VSARGYTAAGVTFRECRDCRGAGEHVLARWNLDPQLEDLVTCRCCGGRGVVRVTRVDVLEALQAERRSALRMRQQPAGSLSAYLAPTAFRAYSDARRAAMAPSPLPSDIAPRAALERAA